VKIFIVEVNAVFCIRGTIEETYVHAVPTAFIDIGKRGVIRPADIAHATIKPWCHGSNPGQHVSKLNNESNTIITHSIPQLIRMNPNSFPFLLPGAVTKPIDPAIIASSKASWSDKC
jgi:2-keto-4-pentenoate hydratase/2-oxohepta-3-ene-1,7-dioic acid hydratase in catechol pathway